MTSLRPVSMYPCQRHGTLVSATVPSSAVLDSTPHPIESAPVGNALGTAAKPLLFFFLSLPLLLL
jgi:hypothetical protein